MNLKLPARPLRWWLPAAVVCGLVLVFAASAARAGDHTETHIVRQDDTLAAIAEEHGMTVKGLLALNPDLVEAKVVHVGELLRVPRATKHLSVPEVVCPVSYTVRAGDTWISVADVHGVSADTLAQVNHRDPATAPAAGSRLCIPNASAAVSSTPPIPPAPRMECAPGVRYVLHGPHPVRLNYVDRELVPGLQVCVQAALEGGIWSILKVKTETGETGWLSSRHVGTWQAYLASAEPTPAPARQPTRTPTPMPTPTPTAAVCRDAWGTSAVAYRVRTGPGTQHAHTGKYVAADQAVCELRRDRGWVYVRLADGTTGWVHGDGIANIRPTPTPIPSPTPTATPAPVAAGAPAPAAHPDSYYTQFLEAKGAAIKAGGNVDFKALLVVKDTIELMLAPGSRHGIPECLKQAGASVVIIPWNEKVIVLPEFAHLKDRRHPYDGTPLENSRGQFNNKKDPVAATPEENVLDLPGNDARGVDVTMHEFAHAIQDVCFTPEERSRWETLYEEAKSVMLFPLDQYLMAHNNDEFFAVLTTVYFNRTGELHEHGIPRNTGRAALARKLEAAGLWEIFVFLEEIYGPR